MFARRVLLASLTAATLTVSQAAQAQTVTPIYGAGASFPSLAYRSLFDCLGVIAQPVGVTVATRRPVPNTCTAGSGNYNTYYPNPNTTAQLVAPSYTNNNGINTGYQYLYSSIGSGGGLNAFVNQLPPTALGSSDPISTTNLFPAYPYPAIDFAGSDAPLDASRNTTYATNARPTRGPRIEIPITSGPIAVPYNSTNFRSLGANGLRLSRATYCAIFTGNILDWNDARITADNGGTNVVAGNGSLALNVVRRSDGSGTTDQLSNHLNTVCAATPTPWTGGVGSTVSWTTGFTSASGSSNLVASISAVPGRVGYVNVSFVAPIAIGGLPTARLANQAGNFIALGPTALDIALSTNAAVNTLVPPAVPAPGNDVVWAPLLPNPAGTTSYPIIGLTYLNFYTCYPSQTVVNALKGNQIVLSPTGTRANGVVTSLVDWVVGFPSTISPYSVPDTIQGSQGFGPLGGAARNFAKSATSRISAGTTFNTTTNTCQ